jgi:hypothetical protein
MRKATKKAYAYAKNVSSADDATLKEFETRDLGNDIAAAGSALVGRPIWKRASPRRRKRRSPPPKRKSP